MNTRLSVMVIIGLVVIGLAEIPACALRPAQSPKEMPEGISIVQSRRSTQTAKSYYWVFIDSNCGAMYERDGAKRGVALSVCRIPVLELPEAL